MAADTLSPPLVFCRRLLLLLGGSLGGLGSALAADAGVSLGSPCLAHSSVGRGALLGLGHLAGRLDGGGSLVDGRDGHGGGEGDLGGGSEGSGIRALALLWRLCVLGEDDEAGKVGEDALLVEGQGLFASVLAAVVDGDADGAGIDGGDAGSLYLVEGEAASSTDARVVLDGLAVDGRAKGLDGARGDALGLFDAGSASAALGASLVEPRLDAELPVLVEVGVWQLVVVLHFVLGFDSGAVPMWGSRWCALCAIQRAHTRSVVRGTSFAICSKLRVATSRRCNGWMDRACVTAGRA